MTRVVKLALLLYWTQVGRPKYFININIKKCWKNICNVIEAYVTIFWQTLFVCKIIVLSHDVCSTDSHAAWLAAACIYMSRKKERKFSPLLWVSEKTFVCSLFLSTLGNSTKFSRISVDIIKKKRCFLGKVIDRKSLTTFCLILSFRAAFINNLFWRYVSALQVRSCIKCALIRADMNYKHMANENDR